MLFTDMTAAAIVAGIRLPFEQDEIFPEVATKIFLAVRSLDEEFGLGLKLFTSGDTDSFSDFSVRHLVLGIPIIQSMCFDPPTPFEAETIRAAVDSFPELPEKYLTTLHAISPFIPGAKPKVAPYLLSWGPTPSAAVCVGVECTQDDDDEGTLTYKFIANQDPNQEWTYEGLDGVFVKYTHPDGYRMTMGVDFYDAIPLSFTEQEVEEYFQQVPEFDNPTLFLRCRYD